MISSSGNLPLLEPSSRARHQPKPVRCAVECDGKSRLQDEEGLKDVAQNPQHEQSGMEMEWIMEMG